MHGSVGSPDEVSGPPSPDTGLDPAPDLPRSSFPKSPLVVLGCVFGFLLVALAAQVLFFSGSNDTAVTSSMEGGGANQPVVHSTDRSETGATGDAETSASSSIDRMNDPGYVTRTIAQGFQEDFRGVVDEAEAACMAREVVGMFGVDRLWQMTQAMADRNTTPSRFDRSDPRFMSEDEVRSLNVRLRPCVSDEAAKKLDLNE